MTQYRVKASRWRRTHRDAAGKVTKIDRLRRGDVVELDPEEAAHLLRSGGLVAVTDDGATAEGTDPAPAGDGPQGGGGQGDATTPSGDPTGSAGEGGAVEGSGQEGDAGDSYAEMSFPDLQAAAKERGLNAGGSADAIRARLREADAAS